MWVWPTTMAMQEHLTQGASYSAHVRVEAGRDIVLIAAALSRALPSGGMSALRPQRTRCAATPLRHRPAASNACPHKHLIVGVLVALLPSVL